VLKVLAAATSPRSPRSFGNAKIAAWCSPGYPIAIVTGCASSSPSGANEYIAVMGVTPSAGHGQLCDDVTEIAVSPSSAPAGMVNVIESSAIVPPDAPI